MVLFLAAPCSPNGAYGDAETDLIEINRKPAEERLRLLTDGAKKERVLSFYGSAPVNNSQDVIRAFNKLLSVYRSALHAPRRAGSGEPVEHRVPSGLHLFDLISIRGTLFPQLIDRKVVAKYTSPMAGVMRPGFADKEGCAPKPLLDRVCVYLQHAKCQSGGSAALVRRPAESEMERQAGHGSGRV